MMVCSFSLLSSDICYHIIEFYSESPDDLYLLRIINKEWKNYAESSLLWFVYPLHIIAPRIYLNHFTQSLNPPYIDQVQSIITTLGKGKIVYGLFESDHLTGEDFRKGIFLIECDPLHLRNSELRVISGISRFEEANKVFDWYNGLQRKSHKRWKFETRKLVLMSSLHNLLRSNHSKYIVPYGIFFSVFCGLLSVYGFYTLQGNLQNDGAFHWENYLSFLCLELIIFSLFVMIFLDYLRDAGWKFNVMDEINIWKALTANVHGQDLFILILLEILVILILIEIILTRSDTKFPWISIIIPCISMMFYMTYCLCEVLVRQKCRQFNLCCYDCTRCCFCHHPQQNHNNNDDLEEDGDTEEDVQVVSVAYPALIGLLFLFQLTILLYGLFLDEYIIVKYPYGYPLIPMFPIFFMINGVLLSRIPGILSKLITRSIGWSLIAKVKEIGKIVTVFSSIFLNVLVCLYAFQPDLSNRSNSWISTLPPIFVVYLYFLSLFASCLVIH